VSSAISPKNLYLLVRSFFPLLAGLRSSDEVRNYGEFIAVAVFAFVIIAALVEYWRFRFHVDDKSMTIQKGLLERETINIPFERIQALHMEQAPWQRFIGLTGLKIDTAGASGSEVDLQALKLTEAKLLRDGIMAARSANVSAIEVEEESSNALVHLTLKELLKVGLTQNHLRNGFIALGAIIALYEPFQSWIDAWLASLPDVVWMVLKWTWFLFIPVGVFAFLIFSFVLSLLGAVFKYYNLQANLNQQEVSLRGGLLKRFEYRIPLSKVQILEWRSNIARRLLGMETLRIFQASAQESNQSGKDLSMAIPGISETASNGLIAEIFQSWNAYPSKIIFKPSRFLFYRILVLRILTTAALTFTVDSYLGKTLIIATALPWAFVSARKIYENHWISVTPDVCMIHSGWLRKKRSMFTFHQLQRVVFNQNVIMRKRGVAHITLATAAGNRTFKYLNEADARELYDWSLASIEQSESDWM
jgi:putative membrane protein